MRIGINTTRDIFCPDLGLCWEQKFKLLGVNFNADTLCYKSNIEGKIKEMVAVMEDWKHRFLSPIGRCTVVKTLVLAKLNHLAFVVPKISVAHT